MKAKPKTNSNAKPEGKLQKSIGLWPTKSGSGFTSAVTSDVLAALSEAKEGGRLFLQEVSDRKNDKMPTYRIVVFPPSSSSEL